jgi:hypothetical protein
MNRYYDVYAVIVCRKFGHLVSLSLSLSLSLCPSVCLSVFVHLSVCLSVCRPR